MAEYIEKWPVVNRLIYLENEVQQYKPFEGFEHAMYRKICEAEIAIGKIQAANVVEVVRCKDCKHHHDCETHFCDALGMDCPDDSEFFCSYGERKDGADNG